MVVAVEMVAVVAIVDGCSVGDSSVDKASGGNGWWR